jgi:predicted TIM-barrel fold metal-dependent hydrolase
MSLFADREADLSVRWQGFAPYLAAIRTGGYARAALEFVRDILGFPDLNQETYAAVSAELQKLNQPGLYDYVLKECCNIAACIQCWQLDEGPYPEYFYHLAPAPALVDLDSAAAVTRLGAACDHAINSIDDLLTCMTSKAEEWSAAAHIVGVKSAHAYGRSIAFARVARGDAERVFSRVLRRTKTPLPARELVPLQDFLMFELLARLEAVRLPMVFHTGLQAGNCNRIANANPLHLQPLLEAFPRARIDLFHGGMPWVREIAVLAKYFPGVHLNMAWMHIISPVQARSALAEWLDMVPNSKIFGFGGDYSIVEKVYGHLKIARRNIGLVLAEKIRTGAMSRQDARAVGRRLMFDNANEFYRLNLPGPRQT